MNGGVARQPFPRRFDREYDLCVGTEEGLGCGANKYSAVFVRSLNESVDL